MSQYDDHYEAMQAGDSLRRMDNERSAKEIEQQSARIAELEQKNAAMSRYLKTHDPKWYDAACKAAAESVGEGM